MCLVHLAVVLQNDEQIAPKINIKVSKVFKLDFSIFQVRLLTNLKKNIGKMYLSSVLIYKKMWMKENFKMKSN